MKAREILYIIGIVVLCTFLLNDCSDEEMTENKTVTVSDTTWNTIERDTTILNITYKDTTIYNPIAKDVKPPKNNRTDSLRHYAGLYDLGFGTVKWKANVSGYLEDISFSGDADIPVINNTKIATVTKTVETTKTPKWNMYVGVRSHFNSQLFEVGPEFNLRIGKINYGYSYGLLNQTHSIGIGAKLF